MFGRDAAKRVIDGLIEEAFGGRSSCLVVRGEAGIGKTALVDHACEAALQRSFVVVRSAGRLADVKVPHAGLLGPIRTLQAYVDEESQAVFNSISTTKSKGFAGDRWALAMFRVLTAASEAAPVLVAVDDADLVDRESIEALLFALNRMDRDQVAALFATGSRPETVFRDAGYPELVLERLDDRTLDRVVADNIEVADSVRAECVRRSEGNPLAALEFARSLSPDQRLGRESLPLVGAATTAATRAFEARLDALSEETRRALVVVAADTTGELRVLARALGELGETVGALEEAEGAGLLTIDDGLVRLTHPLLRPVAYRQVVANSRRAAHRALASALELPRDARARVWQLAAAATGPDAAVAEALDQLARNAAKSGDDATAAVAFERASGLSADNKDRTGRLLAAGLQRLALGDLERAGEHALEVLDSGDPSQLVEAARLIVQTRPWLVGPAATAELLRRRHKQLAEVDSAVADAMLGYLYRLSGDFVEASRWSAAADDQSFENAADEVAREAEALVLGGDLVAAQAVLHRLLATHKGPVAQLVLASSVLARCETLVGLSGAALERLVSARSDAEPMGLGARRVVLDHVAGLALLSGGDAAGGIRALERACLAQTTWGWPPHENEARTDLVEALYAVNLTEAKRVARILTTDGPDLSRGRALRAIGLVAGDLDALDESLAALVTFPLEHARSRLARGTVTGKREETEEAFVALRAMGVVTRMRPDSRPAVEAAPDPLSGLSPAEIRVALVVGSGRANREAAEELFLSAKTVDFHLQNIYRKLAIKSRAELAVIVGRRGAQ